MEIDSAEKYTFSDIEKKQIRRSKIYLVRSFRTSFNYVEIYRQIGELEYGYIWLS